MFSNCILATLFFSLIHGYIFADNDKCALKKHTLNVDGRSYRFYMQSPLSIKTGKELMVLVFLHGLGDETTIAAQRDLIANACSKKEDVVLVCPIGSKGAFKKFPGLYGWTPDGHNEHIVFLRALNKTLKKDFNLEKSHFIGFGFSNGAYFLSNILVKSDSDLFDAYWMQGGGNPVPAISSLIKKKAVLEVSLEDVGNKNSVYLLKDHLLNLGWELNCNLMFNSVGGKHSINLEHLDQVLHFLKREP